MAPVYSVLHDNLQSRWLQFERPVAIISTTEVSEVIDAVKAVEKAVDSRRCWAVGFVAYESAPAFDQAMVTRQAKPGTPLIWFALFPEPRPSAAPPLPPTNSLSSTSNWTPSLTLPAYQKAFLKIKDLIASGYTYQVNYTMRLITAFRDDPWTTFCRMVHSQESPYSAYIDIGDRILSSASPELFFDLRGNSLRAKPMKGTIHRGKTVEGDEANLRWLQESEKNRAENVMIVDMVRNDLSRVAQLGSVSVPRLFEIERYPTLLQMTSTVQAKTKAPFHQILSALFPCASITGAPKIRTMEIIRDLEEDPRGVYTGAIGFLAPDRSAQFNVGIRTLDIDPAAQIAEYGTGSGVVWDSDPDEEYQECLLKSKVLAVKRPRFAMLETLAWEPGGGYALFKRHLTRLQGAARYFSFPLDEPGLLKRLEDFALQLPPRPHRIRLLLERDGVVRLKSFPLEDEVWQLCDTFSKISPTATPILAVLDDIPIDPENIFLYHKTTQRQDYDRARNAHPEHDEVLLWNPKGELTEFTTSNLVVEIDGRRITPPVESGLLAGTLREALLERGEIETGVIHIQDLVRVEQIWAINSVRGIRPVQLDGFGTAAAGKQRSGKGPFPLSLFDPIGAQD